MFHFLSVLSDYGLLTRYIAAIAAVWCGGLFCSQPVLVAENKTWIEHFVISSWHDTLSFHTTQPFAALKQCSAFFNTSRLSFGYHFFTLYHSTSLAGPFLCPLNDQAGRLATRRVHRRRIACMAPYWKRCPRPGHVYGPAACTGTYKRCIEGLTSPRHALNNAVPSQGLHRQPSVPLLSPRSTPSSARALASGRARRARRPPLAAPTC